MLRIFGQIPFAHNRYKHVRSADAFCFDVDSTICKNEGLDDLAKWCNVNGISDITRRTMNGEICFRKSLKSRLDTIKPSKFDVLSFNKHNPAIMSKNIHNLIRVLHHNNKDVFLVSGGFRSIIQPIALSLSIPMTKVYANTFIFDDLTKEYIGFDENEYTSMSGGKAFVIKHIKEMYGYKNIIMIGDGVTDLEASADFFIGYGGVNIMENVKDKADWFIEDFEDISNIFIN